MHSDASGSANADGCQSSGQRQARFDFARDPISLEIGMSCPVLSCLVSCLRLPCPFSLISLDFVRRSALIRPPFAPHSRWFRISFALFSSSNSARTLLKCPSISVSLPASISFKTRLSASLLLHPMMPESHRPSFRIGPSRRYIRSKIVMYAPMHSGPSPMMPSMKSRGLCAYQSRLMLAKPD